MIQSITLRNFGCFNDRDYTLEFDRLNVIVGPNNSGKSTFFKGCNFVRRLPFTGGQFQWSVPGFYSLNSYSDSVYNHDTNKEFRIITKYHQDNDDFISDLSYVKNTPKTNMLTKNNA